MLLALGVKVKLSHDVNVFKLLSRLDESTSKIKKSIRSSMLQSNSAIVNFFIQPPVVACSVAVGRRGGSLKPGSDLGLQRL